MDRKDQLYELCRQYIRDKEIRCAESVYQTDRVAETATELIEDICNVVGYYEEAIAE